MVSINFSELIDALTDRFREIVKQELKNLYSDENGADTRTYLTVEQTAEFLGCSTEFVYKLKYRMPHSKMNAKLYFRIDDLNRYLDSGRVIPGKLIKAA
ncbi:helix-turn-helix domain-containing protein [Dyadobacter fermentans]|uniref:helix-turn-helix domain-containing protein n=1 Tax=Dyadobacter fermentans TaxID=94254 RepID=UPI001CBE86B2|nr:helix-turn-helix domain-containing protein [Dyadobacter fermentans]